MSFNLLSREKSAVAESFMKEAIYKSCRGLEGWVLRAKSITGNIQAGCDPALSIPNGMRKKHNFPVTPAQAGVQNTLKRLDSCFRRNDHLSPKRDFSANT